MPAGPRPSLSVAAEVKGVVGRVLDLLLLHAQRLFIPVCRPQCEIQSQNPQSFGGALYCACL
eukprot:3589035-Rhodomonas_salina.1